MACPRDDMTIDQLAEWMDEQTRAWRITGKTATDPNVRRIVLDMADYFDEQILQYQAGEIDFEDLERSVAEVAEMLEQGAIMWPPTTRGI
jgi:hypothetical protein